VDPDKELIALVRRGDAHALARLLRRHQDGIFTHCLRVLRHSHLAEDVAQDSMVKIMNGLDSYDGRSKFSTWIYTIVHNACLSKLRSEKYRRHASLEGMASGSSEDGGHDAGIASSREPSGFSRVAQNEVHRRLLAALDQLEEEHRSILLLRDSRGMDYEAIAEILKVPVGTVKSRLFRAREALRKLMEQSIRTSTDLSPDSE
jgi:RNA polymerase sigma-70 factor (ECF subfamily)